MESTGLEQPAGGPTIRYSIDELLEYRSSLSYVICPIDEFTLVAWAEGLLDKIGDYVPDELVVRKEYARRVVAMQEQTQEAANPFDTMLTEEAAEEQLQDEITAKHKLEYADLTFTDFLNLGKYGSPPSGQVSVPGSHSQKAQVTPPTIQAKPYTPPKEPGAKSGTSTIGSIQERDAHSQPTSGKGTEKSGTGREAVESNPDDGVQASSHAEEVAEPTPSGEAAEEPEESSDIVDQDAWINAMLERTKIFAGNKYKRT
ncbi:hypothetical protein HOY80DRAFT_1047415 [Tuber brumale]|nr:hypothetical protein HOY80DRAFT_1047415 [Tuber brumale]